MKTNLQIIAEAYESQLKVELKDPTLRKSPSDILTITFQFNNEISETGQETTAEKVRTLVKASALKIINPTNIIKGIIEIQGKRSKLKEFALALFTKPEEVKKYYPYLF